MRLYIRGLTAVHSGIADIIFQKHWNTACGGPGLTNIEKEENGQRLVGMNTENAEINEGLIRFDIIFYVRMKDGISQVIVNLDYSDFRIIPINLFWGLYFSPFRYIYRNKFFSSL